ncbi:MAG: branched-chain amino acid ABC transporter permease [Clostridia bacterium]|nr:branched-chain amino acid ABC transporter permease [Clostridia bacterium]
MIKQLKNVKWKHFVNYIVVGAALIVFAILRLVGEDVPRSTQFLLQNISIAMILAVSLNLVVGFLGELSLGHAGFMCVGAYLGGKIASLLEATLGNGPLTLLLSLVVGGLCAAVCGVIIGLPALRLKGDYLAIVTLAFGEIVKVIFQNAAPKVFGGTLGLPTPKYSRHELYIYGFALVLITLFVIQNLMRSRHGRAITAIRDNEIAARATGINITKYKLMAFTISAFFAGIAGVLFSYTQSSVQAVKFGYNYSIEILVMVVLGGMGNITGSLISATLITYLNTVLATKLEGDSAVLKDMVYAIILITIIIYRNAPGLKGFREKYNFKNLISKIHTKHHDPAYVKDDEAAWDRVPTKIHMDEILSVDVSVDVSKSTLTPDKPSKED